jgi:hypothetical protein
MRRYKKMEKKIVTSNLALKKLEGVRKWSQMSKNR